MIEYKLYEYVRDAYRKVNNGVYSSLTEDLIMHLVGAFGLDILKRSKLIAPTDCYGHYVLCGEN